MHIHTHVDIIDMTLVARRHSEAVKQIQYQTCELKSLYLELF